ncbi:MAG TPA: hypothetical protein VI452_12150 [Marmoricola sp.]|jgi:hypothetical protein
MIDFSRLLPRRLHRTAVVSAMAATALLASPAAAHAEVNTHGAPTTNYHLLGTDCYALVGAVKTDNGAAMGGVDVTCGSNHRLVARAVEYRWNGSSWNTWSSGDWTAYTYYLTVHTGGVCGAPAQWFTRAYVTVDGTTYGPLDSNSSASYYDPPC